MSATRGRKLLLWALLLLAVSASAEVASRLGLALFATNAGGLGRLRDDREIVAAGELDTLEGVARAASQLTAGTSLHPYLGFVQTPRPVAESWMNVHHLPINEFGFIDDKTPLQKRAPQRRIVAITGGSVAFFLGSEGALRLRSRLQALPDFAGREIVLVRLALGGFKQPQQLATLTYLLALGAEFDLLINLDGFNETALYPAESAALGAHPAYPRGWPQIVGAASAPERLRAVGAWAFWSTKRRTWAATFRGPVADRSALAALTWLAGDRWLLRNAEGAQATLRTLTDSGKPSFSAVGPPTSFADEEQLYRALSALWERSSLQLSKLCEANGIRYLHFLQPNQYFEGSKPMTAAERAVAIDPASPYVGSIGAGYPMLREAGGRLRSAGVDFNDLTQLFARHEVPIYVDRCCHLNLTGNELLADAVADRIAAAPSSPRAGAGSGR